MAEQAHIATAKVEDQKLVVDLAAYFDKMSEADRILWNADARMLLNNTNVSFVYTDESTGKERNCRCCIWFDCWVYKTEERW